MIPDCEAVLLPVYRFFCFPVYLFTCLLASLSTVLVLMVCRVEVFRAGQFFGQDMWLVN